MPTTASNADSERVFIYTDQRANLDQSTICSLMAIKFNVNNCCLDIELPPELLRKSKQATCSYLGQS